MKKITIIIIAACIATSAFATDARLLRNEKNRPVRLQFDEQFQHRHSAERFAKPTERPQRVNPREQQDLNVPKILNPLDRLSAEFVPNFDPKKPMNFKAPIYKDFERLDSAYYFRDFDSRIIDRTYFTYKVFSDGLYYPHIRKVIDHSTGAFWETTYEWVEEGPAMGRIKLFQWRNATTGTRTIYTYNAQGFNDEITEERWHNPSQKWVENKRFTYADFDANGYPGTIVYYIWIDDAWELFGKDICTYWPNGQSRKTTSYGWDINPHTNEIVWLVGQETEFAWFDQERPARFLRLYWDWDLERVIGDWDEYWEWEIFNGQPEIVHTFCYFYNPDEDNWNGRPSTGTWNEKLVYTYDPDFNNRRSSMHGQIFLNAEEWIDFVSTTYEYTQNPNPAGDWIWEVNATDYNHWFKYDGIPDEPVIYEHRHIRFARHEPNLNKNIAVYNRTYNYPGHPKGLGTETFFEYNAAGSRTEWKEFSVFEPIAVEGWGLETEIMAEVWESIEYDPQNLTQAIKSIHRLPNTNIPGVFTEFSVERVWIYEWENGHPISGLSFCDEDMKKPCWGWSVEYDFNHKSGEIIVIPDFYYNAMRLGQPAFPYKVEFTTYHVGSMNCDNPSITSFTEFSEFFFWSTVQVDMTSNEGLIIEGEKATVTVFPNPVNDVLYIQTEQTIQQIYVFDLKGRLVFKTSGNQTSIDLSSLPAGHYVARIHTNEAVVPIRIVKN
jgi:hypothetical protein